MKQDFEEQRWIEEDFEQRLMEKYPSLFRKDENGNTLPSSCGIGGLVEWQDIIDSLCATIAEYCGNTRLVKTKNPFICFKYFLHKRIWCPIHHQLMKIIDPYRPYRPKDRMTWTIPPAVVKEVESSKRKKIERALHAFTYDAIYPKNVWVSVPMCAPVTIAQVKSKFGGLRFYIDGGDDAVYGMIRFAERLCHEKSKAKQNFSGTKS